MRHRYSSAVLGCALTALVATACNDFLSGPGIDQDPNNVTNLSDPGPIYVGLQNAISNIYEGQLARLSGMYTQQIAGVARQFLGYDIYQSSSADLDPYWQAIFIGGGLLDARKVQNIATSRGDSLTAGIAKVYEAMLVGTAADFWGDVPFRQAAQREQFPTPAFDPQLQVYEDLQKKLDTAITFLAASGATNLGPNGIRQGELIYAGLSDDSSTGSPHGGLRDVYREVAYTLKARYYLHTAEVTPANYALAKAAALKGISSPANDFMLSHADAAANNNVHYQFYFNRGDVQPGAAYINLLKKRIAAGVDSPDRLSFHFLDVCFETSGNPSKYFGWRPAADANLPGGEGAPAGVKCGTDDAEGGLSDFNWISSDPTFRTPVITFVENQLILAEASYRVAGGGGAGEAAAQTYLNTARANPKYGPQEFAPLPGTLTATLQNIMEEKYLALFLNPEVWNDFKRTCYPFIAPAPAQVDADQPGTEIAGRVPYGLSEINTNGANIPSGPTSRSRNANDPQACPRYTYAPGPTQAY